ncbi:hypothetical protein A1A1_09696 [Planococcus antarcticus DSM 14505]|uniref:Uncharacterized protein n=1 Tax=Planococcus antarcticus DSM 14505 TaxID=1185653 RepID=A0A1C7DHH8_9BACL|nr:hypothetical protein [Planococcus antarcticus]ANU10721.1 hypothetical protein BBH88_10575 [Planococcus antarcticus DSM 14505]EIM06811.1 hypothetical protein A1A1_09696 [Planococcus antarcticus DSM 14505]
MKDPRQTAVDRFNAIDRMINEGLGSGSINPSYTEVHLKLKEKQEAQLRSALQLKPSEKIDDND